MENCSESEASTVSAVLALTERMRDVILTLEPHTDGSTEPGCRAACADSHVPSVAQLGAAETGEVPAEQLASIVSHVALCETLLSTSIAGTAAHCNDVANRLACREEWRLAERAACPQHGTPTRSGAGCGRSQPSPTRE